MTDMRSDKVRKGYEWAPNRSLLRSLGVTDREMNLPFIGIANAYNTIVPGHTHFVHPFGQGLPTGSLVPRDTVRDPGYRVHQLWKTKLLRLPWSFVETRS